MPICAPALRTGPIPSTNSRSSHTQSEGPVQLYAGSATVTPESVSSHSKGSVVYDFPHHDLDHHIDHISPPLSLHIYNNKFMIVKVY